MNLTYQSNGFSSECYTTFQFLHLPASDNHESQQKQTEHKHKTGLKWFDTAQKDGRRMAMVQSNNSSKCA